VPIVAFEDSSVAKEIAADSVALYPLPFLYIDYFEKTLRPFLRCEICQFIEPKNIFALLEISGFAFKEQGYLISR
jgi:hypothetical protein